VELADRRAVIRARFRQDGKDRRGEAYDRGP